MLLIDTSVWIPFLNNAESVAASFIESALNANEGMSINAVIEMEILQGIKDERSYHTVKEYLVDFQYYPDLDRTYFQKATEIFRECRRNGVTIRRSLDCLIAANCLIDNLQVVHQDRDFEFIRRVFPNLMTIDMQTLTP